MRTWINSAPLNAAPTNACTIRTKYEDSSTMPTQRNALEPGTYTIDEAAIRAGISKRTLYRWIDAKTVPGVIRQGRIVRIHRKLYEQWLENGMK
jgi:excisionase family DNA binding protein